jgi:hypothetical protein
VALSVSLRAEPIWVVANVGFAGVGVPMYWVVRHVSKSRGTVTSERSPVHSTG